MLAQEATIDPLRTSIQQSVQLLSHPQGQISAALAQPFLRRSAAFRAPGYLRTP